MTSVTITNGISAEPRRRSSSVPNGPMANGRIENNSYPGEGLVDGRLKRRAKRFIRFNSGENGGPVNVNGSYVRFTKNSRRSRSGFGRGLPKKGGAGGKGTWGKPGSELMMDDDDVPDIHDPNYDPENQFG